MRKYSKTTVKICGTCNFWQGKVEPWKTEKGIAQYHLLDHKGRCCNPDSRSHGSAKDNDSVCVCYLPKDCNK